MRVGRVQDREGRHRPASGPSPGEAAPAAAALRRGCPAPFSGECLSLDAMGDHVSELTCLEICAGAGGQSLGLEQAGFANAAAVEIDKDACATLRLNRPGWTVIEQDVHHFKGADYRGVDLLSGGVPCPPFSIAGKQLGADDERDLFPQALRLVQECEPAAVMLENVRGLSTARFAHYREQVLGRLRELGYEADWQVLNACEFGVPQLRPRFILVALKTEFYHRFAWPSAIKSPPTVGQTLHDLMASGGWPGAEAWAAKANGIGPTLVGGSRKHGGPDLGPTRARAAWLRLHVDGRGLADAPPSHTDPVDHIPRLTLPMAAAIQGFPPDWRFSGRKTAGYRQVGNAFPPPFALAVGASIRSAIGAARADLPSGEAWSGEARSGEDWSRADLPFTAASPGPPERLLRAV